MKWIDEMDILFLQEILAEEPDQYELKSKGRGQIWKRIAHNLNTLKEPTFWRRKESRGATGIRNHS